MQDFFIGGGGFASAPAVRIRAFPRRLSAILAGKGGWDMRRLALCLLLTLPLLCACAGEAPPAREPALPENCRVVYRVESYEGETRTSHTVVTVVQSADGVYYNPGDGAEFLFRRETAETYTMYIRSRVYNTFTVSPGEVVGREKVERFAAGVLHINLLTQDTAGLVPAGEGSAAGRLCTVYEGAGPAGTEYQRHTRLLVDQETGLVLGQWLRYIHQETGAETEYVMICELFETGSAVLPAFSLFKKMPAVL